MVEGINIIDSLKKRKRFLVILFLGFYFKFLYSQNLPLPNSPSYLYFPTGEATGQTVHPSIIDFKTEHGIDRWNGFRYWLAITPYPFSNASYEDPHLFASNDGINWVIPNGITNPLVDAPGNPYYHADPDMVYNPDLNELWIYYRYRYTSAHTDQIRLIRVSANMNVSNPIIVQNNYPFNDSLSFISPCVWRESSNRWHMWGVILGYPNTFIYSSSTDGINWSHPIDCISPSGTNPFMSMGYRPWHPCCKPNYRENRIEFMVASASSSWTGHPANTKFLVYAFAPMDNPSLVTVPFNQPILVNSSNGWDNKNIYRASFIIEDSLNYYHYNIYYSASSLSGRWQTGNVKGKLGTHYSNPDSLTLKVTIKCQNTEICSNDSTILIAELNRPQQNVTFQWYHNDILIPDINGDIYYAKLPGKYHVKALIPSTNFSVTSSPIQINVIELPSPNIHFFPKSYICDNEPITLYTDSNFNSFSIHWITPIGTHSNVTSIITNTPGLYKLTITKNQCSTENTITIEKYYTPEIYLSIHDTTLCPFDTLLVEANVNQVNVNVYWDINGILYYQNSYSFTTSGLYYCYAQNLCGIDYDSIFINKLQPIDLNLIYHETETCKGDSILLTLTNIDREENIMWFLNDQLYARNTDTIYAYNSGGYKAVYIDECRHFSSNVYIKIHEIPEIETIFYDEIICPNGYANIINTINTSEVNIKWLYNNNDTNLLQSPSVEIYSPGEYTLIVSNNCGSDTAKFYLSYVEPIEINMLMSNDTLYVTNEAINYSWYFENNLIPGNNSNFIVPTEEGEYYVVLTDEYGCNHKSDIFLYLIINKLDKHDYIANEISSIKLFDLRGRLVKSYKIFSKNSSLLEKLPIGIYIIEVNFENGLVKRYKSISR